MGDEIMDKQQLLEKIAHGLKTGVISQEELAAFVQHPSQSTETVVVPSSEPTPTPTITTPETTEAHEEVVSLGEKLSAVDLMFYVAGIVLFAAIMSTIVQSWESASSILHIIESAGVGLMLWALSYYLVKSPVKSDIRKGMINALNLTGSMLVIVGGYITTNEIVHGYEKVDYIPFAFALLVMSAIHIGMDRLVRRYMLLLMGVVLGVAAFPTFMFGILQDQHVLPDIWAIIGIITGGLLAAATRVANRFTPGRQGLGRAFDPLAATVILLSMYAASYTDYGVVWLVVLVCSIFGLFYMSIVSQSKQLLGNASIFLILTVITIAFKYFSGYGITVSLIVAAFGLLATAGIAAVINKKYFAQNKVVE